MPFASGDALSAGPKRSEAPPGAEAFSPFGRLSERSRCLIRTKHKTPLDGPSGVMRKNGIIGSSVVLKDERVEQL
jgi:hypothetical protein